MKKYVLSISLFLILIGCNEFLGIQPKGEIIPETVRHYDMLLNNYVLVKGAESYLSYMTDDAHVFSISMAGVANLNTQKRSIKNLYTFQKEVFGESETDDLWSRSYARIYNYNIVLENVLTATEGTEAQKKALWAEALVGRAYNYLALVNAYAKHYDKQTAKTDLAVPLVLKSAEPEGSLSRATVEEVYAQITKDLKDAEPFIPEKPKVNSFRASKKALYGVFARVYLYMGDYKTALDYANKALAIDSSILDIKPYKVTTDVEQSYSPGRIIGMPNGADNPEAMFFKFPSTEYGLSFSVFVSDDLLDLFNYEKDKRVELYFTSEYYGEPLINPLYIPYNYINVGISTPEMYLTAAECEARVGSKDKAMELLNKLRDNRIMDNTPLTAETNDKALVEVLNERRREFTMMGMIRFIDLRRLNKDPRFAKTVTHVVKEYELVTKKEKDPETGEEIEYTDYEETGKSDTYTLEPNSPKYVMPIPPKVMRFNPGMIQNER